MSWKFSIFFFACLLILQSIHSAVETNTANDNEFMLSEDRTQSTASLAEFSENMRRLLRQLGGRLPTRRTDDICLVENVDDPSFKNMFDELEADYKDFIQLVPGGVKGGTYNFITDMRNFSTALHNAKETVKNAGEESAEYQKFQEHHKSELIKVMGRFTKHMIDMVEKYWNSLSVEQRTDAQKRFCDKIQEIKTETDVEKGYKRLYKYVVAD